MIKSIINDCRKPITAYVGSKQVWQYFTIPDLYKKGEKGIWLDPSDLSTMFQDVDGTEPVTENGQPVGLILDKSQGLKQVPKTFIESDLRKWVKMGDGVYSLNGESDRDADITFKVSDGFKDDILYAIEFTITNYDSGKFRISKPFTTPYIRGNGTYRYYGFKQSNSDPLHFYGHELKGTLSNIKVYEIEGNHAAQSVASARPICRTDGNLHRLELDGIDDTLSVQLPPGTYTEIKASRDGVTHKYPVNVNGSYTLGDLTQTKQSVSGLVLVNRQLTQAEIENVTNLMKVKAGLPL